MKKGIKTIGLLLTLMLVSVACDELIDALNITFDLGPYNVEFTVGPEDQGNVVEDIDIVFHDLVAEVDSNGGNMDDLDLVKLKSVDLTLISGATNFNDFGKFDVYIKSPTTTEKKIAWLDPVPIDATMVTPVLTTDNLKEYMLDGEISFRIEADLRGSIQVVKINGEIVFEVNL